MSDIQSVKAVIDELRKDPDSFVSIIENRCAKCMYCTDKSTDQPASSEQWIDNQDVMQSLHISPRTLQTLRSNGTLPFSRIGNKLYYRNSDIQRILQNHYTMMKLRDSENRVKLHGNKAHSYGNGK